MGPVSAPPTEDGKSHESHEGHEGYGKEGHLRQARQAPRLFRQNHQDPIRSEEERPYQEQAWQDREQEEEPEQQVQPMARSREEGPRGTEDQGLLCYQEGHAPLQEGQGAVCPVRKCISLQQVVSSSIEHVTASARAVGMSTPL